MLPYTNAPTHIHEKQINSGNGLKLENTNMSTYCR